MALPLYLSIVGASSNTVIFDLAGSTIAFIILPILVARSAKAGTSLNSLLKTIFTNSFVIAVLLGITLNLLGVYRWLSNTDFIELYTNTMNMATSPIVGLILFVIGYNLVIHMDTLVDVLKFLSIRTAFYILVIVGFFILFPNMMADRLFMIAVIIYFMSPMGFSIPILISPLMKSDDDVNFGSAVISLGMIITLLVYAGIVIFVV